MRRTALLLTLAAVSVLAVSGLSSSNAQAAPTEPITSIVSPTDGGLIPDAVVLATNANYELQCKNPACARFYKFDGGTQVATCTTTGSGFLLPIAAQATETCTGAALADGGNSLSCTLVAGSPGASFKFQSAAVNRLRVAALDGGSPACNLYQDGVNLVR